MPAVPRPLRCTVVNSHTAGEPTRCVLGGLPDLGSGPLAARCPGESSLLFQDAAPFHMGVPE